MKQIKNMSLPLFAVINIVTIIISVSATYYTSNAAQDRNISTNKTSIGLVSKDVKVNKESIKDITTHLNKIDKKADPVTIALMRQSINTLNATVKELKANQKEFMKEQNLFYQKISAKLGITFDN